MILDDLRWYLRVEYIECIQRTQIWGWQLFGLEFQSILSIINENERKGEK